MRVRRGLVGLIALLLCFVVAACGDDKTSGDAAATGGGASTAAPSNTDPITISLVSLKLPGGGGNQLDPLHAGADAALKAIEADGGWGGRKVNLEVCNSLLTPAIATTCAQKTIAKDPVAMIGCEPSWGATGLKIYSAKGVPSFNCLTAGEDYTNEHSFGINVSRSGQQAAMMKYLCTRDDIKTVGVFAYDLPSQRQEAPASIDPVLKACGKSAEYVYFPLTAADMTPYISKLIAMKPDFIETGNQGTQAIQVLKAAKAAGYPSDRIAFPDTAFEGSVIEGAGDAIEGAWSEGQTLPWGLESDPDIAAYRKGMDAIGVDPRHQSKVWGWELIYTLYTAAQKIGFDKFDPATLTEFMNTANGVHIPTSKEIINPGPKDKPQVKQPYSFLSQYKDGKFVPAEGDGIENGWIRALN